MIIYKILVSIVLFLCLNAQDTQSNGPSFGASRFQSAMGGMSGLSSRMRANTGMMSPFALGQMQQFDPSMMMNQQFMFGQRPLPFAQQNQMMQSFQQQPMFHPQAQWPMNNLPFGAPQWNPNMPFGSPMLQQQWQQPQFASMNPWSMNRPMMPMQQQQQQQPQQQPQK